MLSVTGCSPNLCTGACCWLQVVLQTSVLWRAVGYRLFSKPLYYGVLFGYRLFSKPLFYGMLLVAGCSPNLSTVACCWLQAVLQTSLLGCKLSPNLCTGACCWLQVVLQTSVLGLAVGCRLFSKPLYSGVLLVAGCSPNLCTGACCWLQVVLQTSVLWRAVGCRLFSKPLYCGVLLVAGCSPNLCTVACCRLQAVLQTSVLWRAVGCRLFSKPLYCGVLLDQSMMLNRRRDEDDPAEHRVSVFAISVFASCHWRKMVAGFSNLLCYTQGTSVFLSLEAETVLCLGFHGN